MTIVFITLALLIGFYMLWNIGANDVANAIGTSVGSKAISLKKAIIIAGILEFAGAFVLGSNVSETIQSGIINPATFVYNPNIFVIGMLAALMATALWLQIATYFKWPVSTTHAIVGAVLGFGVLLTGVGGVQWADVGTIALSWVVSPSLSALISYFFFAIIQKKILFSYTPLNAAKRLAPVLVFVVLVTFVISCLANGIENIHLRLDLAAVVIIGIIIGIIGGLLSYFYYQRSNLETHMNPVMAARQEQQIYSLTKVQKHLRRAKLASESPAQQEMSSLLSSVESMLSEVKDKSRWETHLSADYQGVEKIFAVLQILTACFVAFAHGANDVANAIGPVSAVYHIILDPSALTSSQFDIPLWLLCFGGLGIVFGLATYGWRVIETIGKGITQLTPTRGFCAEFGAATTILIASKLGLPISTTHSIVGAVLGVGFARGISSLNFKLIRDIFLSWIITIPSSAITCVLIFYIFKLLFL